MKRKSTWAPKLLSPKNVLSEGMKKVMAPSGLNFDHLKLAYRRGEYRVVGEIQG